MIVVAVVIINITTHLIVDVLNILAKTPCLYLVLELSYPCYHFVLVVVIVILVVVVIVILVVVVIVIIIIVVIVIDVLVKSPCLYMKSSLCWVALL